MNKVYKVVFCKATQTMVAVSEFAKGHSKNSTHDNRVRTVGVFSGQLKVLSAVVMLALGGQAYAEDNYFHMNTISGQTGASDDNLAGPGELGGAQGDHSMAAGLEAKATGVNAIAMGYQAYAGSPDGQVTQDLSNMLAVGYDARAEGKNSTAIGFKTRAIAKDTVALGNGAEATGDTGIALGKQTDAAGNFSISIGLDSRASGSGSVAVGSGAFAGEETAAPDGFIYATALGNDSKANAGKSVALGHYAQTDGFASVALGDSAVAKAGGGVALGEGSVADVEGWAHIGADPLDAGGDKENRIWKANAGAVSVGNGIEKTRQITSVAAGTRDTDAVNVAQLKAAGFKLTTSASSGEVEGSSEEKVKNGDMVTIDASKNIKITQAGPKVTVATKDEVEFTKTTVGNVVTDAATNKITGLEAGTDDNDAVNVSQLNAAITGAVPETYFHVNENSATQGAGDAATNLGGIRDKAGATGKFAVTAGVNAKAKHQGTVAIGHNAEARGLDPYGSVAVGGDAKALGRGSVAIGKSSKVKEDTWEGIAIGSRTFASQKETVVIGSDVEANGTQSIVIGHQSGVRKNGEWVPPKSSDGAFSVAIGSGTGRGAAAQYAAEADGKYSIVMGTDAKSETAAESGVAIGRKSKAEVALGVALGSESVSKRNALTAGAATSNAADAAANTVYAMDTAEQADKDAISATVKGDLGALSVGNDDKTRQIINVAAGSNDSDAVNVAQLKAVAKQATAETKVAAGDGVVVTSETDEGVTTYTVASDFAPIESTDGIASSTVTGNTQVGTVQDIVNAINNSGFKLTTSASDGEVAGTTDELINPGETVTIDAGKNIKVTQDANKITVATKNDVEFNSVTIGDATDPNKSTTLTSGPNGLDVGGDKITNVADGDISPDSKDAVNGSQLDKVAKASKEVVKSDDQTVTVATTQNGDGANVFDLSIQTDDETLEFVPVDPADPSKGKKLKAVTTTLADANDDGKVDAPANPNSLATAGDIADAINNSGFTVTSSADGGVANGSSDELVNPGDKLEFVAGEHITIDQAGSKFTFKTNNQAIANDAQLPVVYTKADGTKVYKQPDGTFNEAPDGSGDTVAPADIIASMQGAGGSTTEPTRLTNVASTLPGTVGNDLGAPDSESSVAAPALTDSQKANAATVDDVLNSGWNLQNNGDAKDFVKPYDTVNFVDGAGTEAVVTVDADNEVSDVTYNVNADEVTTQITGEKADGTKVVKVGDKYFEMDADGNPTATEVAAADVAKTAVSAKTGDLTPNDGTDPNKPAGTVTAEKPDSLATAGDIADAINNSGFTVTSSADGGVANGSSDELVNPGDKLEFVAGEHITIDQAGSKFTFKTNNQAIANDAQLPVVYTKADGTKVYKQPDGTFNEAPDGSGDTVAPADIIASMQGAGGSTTEPTKLANVESTIGHNNGEGAINEGDAKTAVGDLLTQADDLSTAATVGDLQAVAQAGLNFKGDDGTVIHKPLSSQLDIIGGADKNKLTDNNIGVNSTADGKLKVQLAKDLTGLDSVVLGTDATDPNTVALTKDGINAGSKKITNVADGDISPASKDAVNGSQIHNIADKNATNVFGGNATVNPDGSTSFTDIGGTGEDTIHDAIQSINNSAANANKGFKIAGNSDVATDEDGRTIKPTETLTVVGDAANTDFNKSDKGKNIYTQVSDNKITVALAKDIEVDSVKAGDTKIDNDGLTINGGPSVTKAGIDAGDTKITNVADGDIAPDSKDAINGSQLYDLGDSTAKALGGESKFDPETGKVTAGLNVGGNQYNNVQDALTGLNATASAHNTTTAGKNIEVVETPNADGGINYEVKTKDDVDFNNVTVSNGLTVGPNANVDMGGNQIHNVAPGKAPGDAVNFSQLNNLGDKLNDKIDDVEDDANAGTSSAMAQAAIPQAYIPGKTMLAGGIGTYNGQSAAAVGVSKLSDNGRWVFKLQGSADTSGNLGAAGGVGMHF